MKRNVFVLLVILLFSKYFPLAGQGTSKDAYEVLVYNQSTFDIKCVPQCEKDEGVFMTTIATLAAGKTFLFRIMKTPGGILPRGVEGTITFRLTNQNYPGTGQVHFNDPVVGADEFEISASNWPIKIEPMSESEAGKVYMGYFIKPYSLVKITVDTSRDRLGNHTPPTLGGVGSNTPAQSMLEPIPPVINFDWKVTQRMRKDDDDEKDGKAYKEVTYFFTTNGDYTAAKPDDASFSLMIYSKKGHTWIMDDKKKTITVMSMPKIVGEGAAMGKEVAEEIKKAPLQNDRDDETFTMTKTGKTKKYLGYTADEFEMKNTTSQTTKSASKSGTAFFWYATVPFDPVKIYTMGAGRPADISKLKNDPRIKNNFTAIPVLNKNYLMVEIEVGGLKGQETTEIKKVNTTISTSGYTVKQIKGLKDMVTDRDN